MPFTAIPNNVGGCVYIQNMGRAKGAETTSTSARFDAAVGTHRGLRGHQAIVREREDADYSILIADLRDQDRERAPASARILVRRLQAGDTTTLQRSILWSHCVGAMEIEVKETLLGGLRATLADGELADIEAALSYLVSAEWNDEQTKQKEEIGQALIERFQHRPTLDAALGTAEFHNKLIEAYTAAPHSKPLAAALMEKALAYASLSERVAQLLVEDPQLNTMAALAKVYKLQSNAADADVLETLAGRRLRVQADDAFAPLLGQWVEAVRTRERGRGQLVEAAFTLMGTRWEESDDGYDGLRMVMRECLQAQEFPTEARAALEVRTADGRVTPLALEVIAAAAANPQIAEVRWALGETLARLPEENRKQTQVLDLAQIFERDCAHAFEARAQNPNVALIKTASFLPYEEREQLAKAALYQPYQTRIRDIGLRAGRAYAQGLLSGHNPNAAAYTVILDDVADLLGEYAAKDSRLLGLFEDYDIRAWEKKVGRRRLRNAFKDPQTLSAVYRAQLQKRAVDRVGGPESLMEVSPGEFAHRVVETLVIHKRKD